MHPENMMPGGTYQSEGLTPNGIPRRVNLPTEWWDSTKVTELWTLMVAMVAQQGQCPRRHQTGHSEVYSVVYLLRIFEHSQIFIF